MITTQYAAMAGLGATAVTYPTVYNGALGVTNAAKEDIRMGIELGGAALVGALGAFVLASRGRGWAAAGAGIGAALGAFIGGQIAIKTVPFSV